MAPIGLPAKVAALGRGEKAEAVGVAYLRRRSGGRFSVLIYWDGKKHRKGLGTTDPAEAERIRADVEEQLRRIRNGESPKARQLLDEGFSIVEVLFGCPEIDKRLECDPGANPLTLQELSNAYLDFQLPTVGPDERYNSTARFKKLCSVVIIPPLSKDGNRFVTARLIRTRSLIDRNSSIPLSGIVSL